MNKLYKILVNIMVFFFVWEIFRKTMIIGGGVFVDELSAAIIFAVLSAFIPNILKFFKMSVNLGSSFLMNLLISFLFFFVQIKLLSNINLTGNDINLGLDFLGVITIEDATYALVLLSLVLSAFSTLMEYLKKK